MSDQDTQKSNNDTQSGTVVSQGKVESAKNGPQGGNGSSQKKSSKILIVEDDPVLLKMYSEKFNFEGFQVFNAKNGEEALNLATSNPMDIILLDIMLPRMSGTDFLEQLRKDAKVGNTPVVALTNLAEEEEKQKAIKMGVKEYLVKAMQTPEQVVEKIKGFL